MVSETTGKLLEGIDNKSGKKAVKYSIAFDGILPSHSNVFTNPSYASEDIALPEAVMGHVKKETGHHNIYVLDRGLQSTRTMVAFSQKQVTFICRAKENRKFVELGSLMTAGQEMWIWVNPNYSRIVKFSYMPALQSIISVANNTSNMSW